MKNHHKHSFFLQSHGIPNLILFILLELNIVLISISIGIQSGKEIALKSLQKVALTRITPGNIVSKQITPTIITIPTTNPGRIWETYSNTTYSFLIKYPLGFHLIEDMNKDDYYDELVSLTNRNININIEAIHDIDVYKNGYIGDVAFREVMDSGFKYEITNIVISGYKAAITILKTEPNPQIIATIAHPAKNLYIQITSDTNMDEFTQLLSTFRYTD